MEVSVKNTLTSLGPGVKDASISGEPSGGRNLVTSPVHRRDDDR
jgi:hypothetical protein